MRRKPIFELGKFEQAEKSRKNLYMIVLISLVAIYYLYTFVSGLGVDVVEQISDDCELVKDFNTPYYTSRGEGIFELKRKTSALNADTLFVPRSNSNPSRVTIGEDVYVYVPAFAYKCNK